METTTTRASPPPTHLPRHHSQNLADSTSSSSAKFGRNPDVRGKAKAANRNNSISSTHPFACCHRSGRRLGQRHKEQAEQGTALTFFVAVTSLFWRNADAISNCSCSPNKPPETFLMSLAFFSTIWRQGVREHATLSHNTLYVLVPH